MAESQVPWRPREGQKAVTTIFTRPGRLSVCAAGGTCRRCRRRISRPAFRIRSRDGAEFLLVFDDGDFDEDNTFLAGGGDDVDWQAHKFVGERREPVGLSLQALIRLKRDL